MLQGPTERDIPGPTEQVQIMFPLKDKTECRVFEDILLGRR